jgi:hypothetical protein
LDFGAWKFIGWEDSTTARDGTILHDGNAGLCCRDSVELDELSPPLCTADFPLTSDAELNCCILANVGNADVLAVQSQ